MAEKPVMWKPPPPMTKMVRRAPEVLRARPGTGDLTKVQYAPVEASFTASNGKYPPPPPGGAWSPYQIAVFDDVISGVGHTVVEAYAGSSKSTVLIAALQLVPAKEEVFFCAFSKDIVTSLKSKVPWCTTVNTIHSYGFSAVREVYGPLKPNPKHVQWILDKNFPQIAYEIRGQIKKLVSLAKSVLAHDVESIDAIIDNFSLAVGDNRPLVINIALQILEICKSDEEIAKGTISFEDQVWLPIVKNMRTNRYDRVYVDECQDLNPAQIELVKKAVKPTGRFTAVGDRAQAIFGWAGADSSSISNIQRHFDAKVLPLPICYRCPVAVVQLAQEVVPGIQSAPNAPQGIVASISGQAMFDIAEQGDVVLSRTNAALIPHALHFIAADRRAIVFGRDIGTSLIAHVKRSKASTVSELLEYTALFLATEKERLLGKKPPNKKAFEIAHDRAACVRVLCKGCNTIQEVLDRIDRLFTDADNSNSIIFSTVHRYKGKEANRVFILTNTFRHRPEYWEKWNEIKGAWWVDQKIAENKTEEEIHVWYVAISRAKSELMLVNAATPHDESEE